jgi:hypothetical protein
MCNLIRGICIIHEGQAGDGAKLRGHTNGFQKKKKKRKIAFSPKNQ